MRYVIRNDVPPRHAAEVARLADLIASAVPSGVVVEVLGLPAPHQIASAGAPVVSLDKRYMGDHQLRVSRLFADHAVGDPQERPLRVVARPGTSPLVTQMRNLPTGPALFVDDDVASGFTRDQVLGLLAKVRPDIEPLGWERFATAYTGEVYDVVDASDFIAPALHDGGLVVDCGGVWMRQPYWSRHVNLATRARLPNTIKGTLRHLSTATDPVG